MGSSIELNDTLQITSEQGFPVDVLNLDRHRSRPITLSDVGKRLFQFTGKAGPRIFQIDPVRVYLVHNIGGKWLFWGHALVQNQEIKKVLDATGKWTGGWETVGSFLISLIYDPDQQVKITQLESPSGLSFFPELGG